MFCIVISILYPYHPALMAFGALNLGTDITAFYFILKKYVKKKKQKPKKQEIRKPLSIQIGSQY